MIDDKDRRLIEQLMRKVDDSIELSNERERDARTWRATHEAWRKSVDDRLQPMDEFLRTANISWKLVLGAIAFTAAVFKCWDLVRAHFRG